MGGEFEAAGALANAGLVAGAIEGREPLKAGEGGACRNCEQPIVGMGRFCANCGQATHAHRKVWHLVEEFLHNMFHLDTKAYRTLPMLIGRPGTLTRNYTYGKRARYVSPLTTFLLTIFFMFFAFSFVKSPLDGDAQLPGHHTAADARENLAEAQRDLAEEQRDLDRARQSPDPDQPAGLELRLAEQGVRLAQAEVTRRQQALARAEQREREAAEAQRSPVVVGTTTLATVPTPGAAPATTTATPPATATTATTTATSTTTATARPAEHLEEGTWQQQLAEKASQDDFVVFSGNPVLNERIKHTMQNPDLMIYKMSEAASKYTFLLVPLSLPFLWLLFIWKRGLTLYDHSVFALYALSFVSLLFAAVVGLAQVPWLHWAIPWVICVGLPVHIFFQMKGAYALGWWSALWRTFFMLIFAFVALTLWAVIVVFLGLLG